MTAIEIPADSTHSATADLSHERVRDGVLRVNGKTGSH
jgi:hypothetical protein